MVDQKLMKLAVKEGGKKGQDISGIFETGTLAFFNLALKDSHGEIEYVLGALDGLNKEVDPNEEERKGGAGNLAKMLLSYNDNQLVLVAHVPANLQEKITAKEWMTYVQANIKDEDGNKVKAPIGHAVEEFTDGLAKVIVKRDPENKLFPIKLNDTAIAASNEILRSKGLVPEDDDSDEGENYASNFDW